MHYWVLTVWFQQLLCGPFPSGPVLHAKCLVTGKSSYEGMYVTYHIIPSTVLQYPYRNGTATHACLAWRIP